MSLEQYFPFCGAKIEFFFETEVQNCHFFFLLGLILLFFPLWSPANVYYFHFFHPQRAFFA